MALIDTVKKACRRLAKKGWAELLIRHGLDITKADLAKEFRRPLVIDRGIPGFEDFCLAGHRGIEPGSPAASLLYHALASPDVHPTPTGQQAPSNDAYPTLVELDAIENYIFSLEPLKKGLLKDAVVAVFAYEYRPASATAHEYHADMVYSRTGIARVGNGPMAWDGPTRGFRADPPGRDDLAVLPARYGAFLAVRRTPSANDPIMGRRGSNDALRPFCFPVRKLFAGDECIRGSAITIKYKEYHRNDKLKRVHTASKIPALNGFDIDALPFVRDSTNDEDFIDLWPIGDSVLVVAREHKPMVRTAKQRNSISGKSEIVRFKVPPKDVHERYASSLEILQGEGRARRAPEYLNIRHRVITKKGSQVVEDMQNLPDETFKKLVLDNGGFEAAHFVDDSCDGAVVATVSGLPKRLIDLAAYSLVAAPDFFPLSDQFEISNWVRSTLQTHQEQFKQGAPWPLCEGRLPANIELPRPGSQDRAFSADDQTIAAVVGTPRISARTNAPGRRKRFSSHLPDSASNVFDPGWDVSLGITGETLHYAAYGLGSPFPEDAKLCAALNSFWPAVAPDASRTFRYQEQGEDHDAAPTAIPMLDQELGYHPDHPRVRSGAVKSARGWDGEYGPFFERVGGKDYVNFADILRSDYVSNALNNTITVRLTSPVNADQLKSRMQALRRCIKVFPPPEDIVSNTTLWLVVAEPVPNWDLEPSRANSRLIGAGYIYVFVKSHKPQKTGDITRLRARVQHRYECQVSADAMFRRQDDGTWREAV